MFYQKILNLYKELGETPLARIERFRDDNPEYKDLPMTYAGRLDPMAEGLLLVLVGEECKRKDEYLGLSKEYTGEVLLGISTDTGDVLGLPSRAKSLIRQLAEKVQSKDIAYVVKQLVGKQVQEYPAYSSKTVGGKPLWKFAREGEEVKKPARKIEVYEFEIVDAREERYPDVLKKIRSDISKVKGDFRQEDILDAWRDLKEVGDVQIVSFRCKVSSGTYVRALAEKFGRELGVPACLFSLKRTRVGEFNLEN